AGLLVRVASAAVRLHAGDDLGPVAEVVVLVDLLEGQPDGSVRGVASELAKIDRRKPELGVHLRRSKGAIFQDEAVVHLAVVGNEERLPAVLNERSKLRPRRGEADRLRGATELVDLATVPRDEP